MRKRVLKKKRTTNYERYLHRRASLMHRGLDNELVLIGLTGLLASGKKRLTKIEIEDATMEKILDDGLGEFHK